MRQIRKKTDAFTLIELLVVMAIISALVGLLSVGLRQVKIVATNLKQKGEFHGMEVSIELFRNEFNYYPESTRVDGGSDYTCGAQHLAEAMEGRDELGFHPKSKWHPALEPTAPDDLYTDTTADLKQRKPVYFELKHSGLYTPEQLWGTGSTTPLNEDCPVITDVFVRNEPADPANEIDGKVGSPVLYFAADSTRRFRVDSSNQVVDPAVESEYVNWIYNLNDNIDVLNLAWLRDPAFTGSTVHYTMDPENPSTQPAPGEGTMDPQYFYELITLRQDTATGFYRPFNKDTFILISAGWDGIFGTKDDLTNYNY